MGDAQTEMTGLEIPKKKRIAHWARSYFWDRGITQKQLALAVNLHPSALSLILKGERSCPEKVETILQSHRQLLEENEAKNQE